jgi:hypothetical protein
LGLLAEKSETSAAIATPPQCHELVQKFSDREAKRTMLSMADAWLMLAAQHVKPIETVDVLFGPMRAEG